jgi:N-acetylneuraminic acid mutarotase/sugar lactone lactonase YvrE
MPSFSVAQGTYTSVQTVTISDTTPGAVIYYAINGTPTTSSSVYSGSITVSASETIEAMAIATGYSASQVASAAYTITASSSGLLPTSTALTSSSNPAMAGASITFTATVSSSTPGAGVPTGSVSFADQTGIHTSEPLVAISSSASSATLTTSAIGIGSDVMSATYSSDTVFATSAAHITQTVDAYPVTITLIGTPNPLVVNQVVTFTVTVANPTGSSVAAPTGSVTFSGIAPGSANSITFAGPITLTGGAATAHATLDLLGLYSITVSYSGDVLHTAGTATIIEQVLSAPPSPSNPKEWTWMGGSNTVGVGCTSLSQCGRPGVYGTLGTPSAANIPGGRIGSASWTDQNGHHWLFGGWGYDANGDADELNDLWEFNPSTNQWTWMGGSNTTGVGCSSFDDCGWPGVYGTLGSPAAENIPGSRHFATAWVDKSGNFWLFGGYAFDVNGFLGPINDLWEFNPTTKEWAWISGGNVDYSQGVYGTLGSPASGNTPGSRMSASGWTDNAGNFRLFGGYGMDANGNMPYLNDLWEFNPTTKEWAWVSGSSTAPASCALYGCSVPGVNGTLGVPATGNMPEGRTFAATWTDGGGNLWLFGGECFIAGNPDQLIELNDLWEYIPSSSEWAWMGGTSALGCTGDQPGVYGTLGVPTVSNIPGGRGAAATWTDGSGNFLLFGGVGVDGTGELAALNDLWEFNPPTKEWTWIDGSSTGNQSGVYGTLGTPAAGNIPGGRYYPPSWSDGSGNLWLFGGLGWDATGTLGYLNDIWEYGSTTSSPAAATPTFSVPQGTYTSAQSVTISDTTPYATIYYAINGTPTTNSTQYNGAITASSSETIEAIAVASGYAQSAVATAAYTITPSGAISTTTLSASATALTAGQTLTLTATVTATSGSTPTGTVTILNGAVILGSAQLNNGVATLTLTPAVGSYSITASYGGSVSDAASVSSPPVSVMVTNGTKTSPNIYTYAGDGIQGYSGDGGPAIDAELNLPHGVVSDAAGNIYYAEGNNNRVRKIVRATNVITTVAGTGAAGYSGDGGPAKAAMLDNPYDVALDAAGNLYIADAWNACIRKVNASTGIITTFAGICTILDESGNGGPATQATVILPLGVAVDPSGNVFITDTFLVHEVSAATGNMTIFAGKINATELGDGGPATEAQLLYTIGIATDSTGNVYIVDSNANRVRKVTVATGIITTVAGTGTFGYSPDGGQATQSDLSQPNDVATDALGNIYFSDSSFSRVRRVDAQTGILTTVAGDGNEGFSGDGGPAIDATMAYPEGLWFDSAGNLYIADSFNNRIRVVGAPPNAGLIATTTVLTAFPASLSAGQTLTLTATVTPVSGAAPTGTVTFYNGTTSLGNASLNGSGVAQLILTPSVGSYSITANYGGSSTDAPSTSSPPIVVSVNAISTTTTLNAVPTSLSYGQTLTLTATVSPASGATPTGTVTFYNGPMLLGNAPLNGSGVASLQLTPAVGSYSITASYGGSTTNASSVSSPAIAVAVNTISTTTALTAVPTSLSYGQTLTLTATVTAASGSMPTGTVTFSSAATTLGSAPLNGSGVATLVLTPAVGSYSITASYGGSTNDTASASSSVAVNVIASNTTTSLIASPNPAPFGASVTFTVMVANSASGSTITPTGNVSFYDGATLLGTATLAAGAASYSTGSLSVGSHNITATYAGGTGFNSSTSNMVAEVISPADFSISASPASQTIYTGEAASYTVTITPGTGFNLPVALSCSHLPVNTTCSFLPPTVPGGSTSSTLVVQTSAPIQATSVFVPANKLRIPLLTGLLLLFIPRRLRRFRNGWPMCLLLLALLIAGAAITGCSAPRTLLGGTPVGNPNITITGIATNGSQTLTHATAVTLNVESLF